MADNASRSVGVVAKPETAKQLEFTFSTRTQFSGNVVAFPTPKPSKSAENEALKRILDYAASLPKGG
jgi:hypothetical protein